jgi:nitroreductase
VLLREAILARRSVRRYTKQGIGLEQLLALVDCGRQAPTASNLQAWEFILIQDPGTLRSLTSLAPGISAGAEAIIAICTDREKARRKAGEGGELFGLMDACFAAENLLLAATDAGLGACVVRSFHQDAARRVLAAPDHVVPELLITLGYPEAPLPRGPRRRSMEDIIHLDRWGSRLEEPIGAPADAVIAGVVEAAGPPRPPSDASSDAPSEVETARSASDGRVGADAAALRTALRLHLSYLAASAHGLLTEPPSYGPYRLVDSLSRLVSVMDQCGLADQALLDAQRLIEERKLDVVDDTDRFRGMVGEVLRVLVGESG